MAFNVQENAVFIPEFSKISLPWEGEAPLPPSPRSVASLPRFAPPPAKNPGYGSECINLSRIRIYVYTEFGPQSMARDPKSWLGGGGGGGVHEIPPFFSASQNSPALQKLNHVVSPPPSPTFRNGFVPLRKNNSKWRENNSKMAREQSKMARG